MKTEDVLGGIDILSCYYKKDNKFTIGADHDVIYMYATDEPLSEKDYNKMKNLGWSQTTTLHSDTYRSYDPEESWCAYV